MRPKHRFSIATLTVATLIPAFAIASCDLASAIPTDLASAAAGCPSFASVAAVAKVDFAKEFGIDAKVGGKLKAGVQAALELKGFAAKLDADLRGACGGLAKDLGASGDWKTGKDACSAAMKAMADIKGKIGGNLKIAIAVEPPHCAASLDAMAKCVADCDVSVDAGSVDVKCDKGKLAGTCDAQCSGSCEMSAAATCSGTCHGSCSASFSGSCGGECNGTCDGKQSKGVSCAGKCEGSCSANAQGSCGGQCSGSCEMSAAAKCSGTCRGECSVEMKAPKCEGKITPPKASAECQASCQTKMQAQLKCTPPKISVNLTGGANAQLVAKYKTALEANLPAIISIAVGMKDQALSVAGNVKAVAKGVVTAAKKVKGDAKLKARLAACVGAPVKAALDAAASVQVNVNVSVQVKASASASGSAKAG